MFLLIFSGGNLHFTIKEENDIVNRDKITIGFTKNVYYTFQSKRSGIDQEPGSQPDTDSYTNIRLQICCFIKKKFTVKNEGCWSSNGSILADIPSSFSIRLGN